METPQKTVTQASYDSSKISVSLIFTDNSTSKVGGQEQINFRSQEMTAPQMCQDELNGKALQDIEGQVERTSANLETVCKIKIQSHHLDGIEQIVEHHSFGDYSISSLTNTGG